MCGRFGRFGGDDAKSFADYFAAILYAKHGWKQNVYNCLPTDPHAMVYEHEHERRLVLGRWGWKRDFSKAPLINARGEEAANKRTWAEALRRRRCVVPASLFYEWRPVDGQPFAFALTSKTWFGIGGLWEETESGPAFILLTTVANTLTSPVHDRMPLILAREDEADWLSTSTPSQRVQDLIRPYPTELMVAWPVSKRVSSRKNEDADLIAPVV